jgi:hypothetical protein
MQQDDDWRLTGQERYLTGAKLEWAEWQPQRPDWDHDHCEFCGTKFAGPESPGSLHAGFATADRYWWVCPQCVADFRRRFGWLVIESAPDAEPPDAMDSR